MAPNASYDNLQQNIFVGGDKIAFRHANGDVKPHKVQKLEVPKDPAATASTAKPAAPAKPSR